MAMTLDDYREEVLRDAREMIETESDYYKADTFDHAFEELFLDDGVTGNASGSYTFSTAQAAENVSELIWDSDFADYMALNGYESIPIERGSETLDVIIRCLVLNELYSELESVWEDAHYENSDERKAVKQLIEVSGLEESDAKYLIEWWSTDNPLEWAESFAPYIYTLDDDEAPEEHENEYPYDTVIVDNSLSAPVVISETRVHFYK